MLGLVYYGRNLFVTRNKRHQRIVVLVRAAGEISVDDLAEKLEVSKETIRRDLSQLDQEGLVKKFHGGARAELSSYQLGVEGSFSVRMMKNIAEKKKLCALAAEILQPRDTLFVDTGSTTTVFAEVIVNLPKLTIITNSNTVAKIASANSQHDIFLLGGSYRRDNNENVGMLTVEQIQKFHANYAVLTVGAVSPSTISDYDVHEAEIACAMIKQSEKVLVLADHSKFGQQATFDLAALKDIDYLVTDRKPFDWDSSLYDDLTLKLIY